MKKITLIILAPVLLLTVVITVNTLQFTSKQSDVTLIDGIAIDSTLAAQRLSTAVQLATVSHQNPEDAADKPFFELLDLISTNYPLVAQQLEKTVINEKSLLLKWSGGNEQLKPITFLAHLDVVPPEPNTLDQWQYPPFSGAIAEGFIWGRGTLDDKSAAFGVLEAIEHLIGSGFVPSRTIYLAFGHDEEIGGSDGAAKIAEHMEQQGISSLFTLDEGMVVLDQRLSPAKKPTAIIGIAEKGYMTITLTARTTGGHSSMPPPVSATGTLADAIVALEDNQLPSKLAGSAEKTFDFLGPEMGFVEKILFANRWLFDAPIVSILEQQTSTMAMIRTTTAVTMIDAGVKENVLPSQASATVNFRILPGSSSTEVLEHVNRVIGNPAVTAELSADSIINEPSSISATDTAVFATIGKTAQQLFPNSIFAPGLVLGGTDSIHYQNVADNNYRFAPYVLGPADLSRVHGINERIRVEDYARMIKFYAQLIINMDNPLPAS